MAMPRVRMLAAVVAAAVLAGCFDEPVAAHKTVPPGSEVYLKDVEIRTLARDDIWTKGKVFVRDSGWADLRQTAEKLDSPSITYLNLDRDSLENADAACTFPSLKFLRLNGNKLQSLEGLGNLRELKRLYLRGNSFAAVPAGIRDLPGLELLDMSDNPGLSAIPDWLAAKRGLRHLSFSGTALKSLPQDLSAWRESLRTLQLTGLQLPLEEMRRIRAALPDADIVF